MPAERIRRWMDPDVARGRPRRREEDARAPRYATTTTRKRRRAFKGTRPWREKAFS